MCCLLPRLPARFLDRRSLLPALPLLPFSVDPERPGRHSSPAPLPPPPSREPIPLTCRRTSQLVASATSSLSPFITSTTLSSSETSSSCRYHHPRRCRRRRLDLLLLILISIKITTRGTTAAAARARLATEGIFFQRCDYVVRDGRDGVGLELRVG